ncbi:MAG: SigE family RNA polymerase sigma factor [Actinomycetes bacterium]
METQTHAVVEAMFVEHGRSLVRLASLFVDDRAAAEDLVQEAFIRLSRSLDRIRDPDRAAAYLRSIVLNLARDHNRRGLVSLRHRPPALQYQRTAEEDVELEDEHRLVVEALRALPRRQRDVLVLRYYLELSPPEVAETLGLSVNSVKTHQRRGMAAMQDRLGGAS